MSTIRAVVAAIALVVIAAACGEQVPSATCAEFDTQPEAQAMAEAGDVRISDPDGDGVYCESLPGAP